MNTTPHANSIKLVHLGDRCPICHDVGIRPLGERWALCCCPMGQDRETLFAELPTYARGQASEPGEDDEVIWLAAEAGISEDEAERWLAAGTRPRSGVVAASM